MNEKNYVDFYNKINIQKQIKELSKKYKNKKIVIYGAGIMTKELFQNFDLSPLNIVAICDKKYEKNKEDFYGISGIGSNDLKDFDCDVILINVAKLFYIYKYLELNVLTNSKNENVIVEKLYKLPLSYIIKNILG